MKCFHHAAPWWLGCGALLKTAVHEVAGPFIVLRNAPAALASRPFFSRNSKAEPVRHTSTICLRRVDFFRSEFFVITYSELCDLGLSSAVLVTAAKRCMHDVVTTLLRIMPGDL